MLEPRILRRQRYVLAVSSDVQNLFQFFTLRIREW